MNKAKKANYVSEHQGKEAKGRSAGRNEKDKRTSPKVLQLVASPVFRLRLERDREILFVVVGSDGRGLGEAERVRGQEKARSLSASDQEATYGDEAERRRSTSDSPFS